MLVEIVLKFKLFTWKECIAGNKTKSLKQTTNHGSSPCHGWVEKQNKTKYKSGPSPCLWLLLKSVSLGVICAGQEQALSSPLSPAHQMRRNTLDTPFSKRTSVSPFPLHFWPSRRDGLLKIQVSGKSIVKGKYFQANSVWSFFFFKGGGGLFPGSLPSSPDPGSQLVSAQRPQTRLKQLLFNFRGYDFSQDV